MAIACYNESRFRPLPLPNIEIIIRLNQQKLSRVEEIKGLKTHKREIIKIAQRHLRKAKSMS